jgi:hypothetical protein
MVCCKNSDNISLENYLQCPYRPLTALEPKGDTLETDFSPFYETKTLVSFVCFKRHVSNVLLSNVPTCYVCIIGEGQPDV